MSSPKYTIDGRQDGKLRDSRTTNNLAEAEAYASAYAERYGRGLVSKLARIEQGVAVYEPMKEYEPWTGA
jgi:hypothetical protein